jgi:hypothetical protein
MSVYIKRFQVTGYINSGDDKIFINALESDIPNGSILLIGSTLTNFEQKKSIEYNSDGSFSLETALNNNYPIGTFVDLISLPPENLLPPESPCRISFDGEDLYNFSIALDKTYTITFGSGEAFNQFEIINHGEHEVIKEYPTITLRASPLGPKNFQYKTHRKIGSINVDDSCNLCPSLNFEVFKTSDEVKYFHEVGKYLIDCGSSILTKSILDVRVIDCSCDFNTFLVIYCCDLSKDISNQICGVSWTFDCNDSNSQISPPDVTCIPPDSTFDSWYYSATDSKLRYNKKSHICFESCTAQDIYPTLLIEPDLPSQSEIDLCPSSTPKKELEPPPIYQTPSFFPKNPDGSDFKTHLAGDKPHYPNNCCILASSEVLEKPFLTDLSYRSFYKESSNGYFYETQDLILTNNSNFTEINDIKYNLKDLEEDQSYLDFPTSGNLFLDTFFSYGPDFNRYQNFVSIVDYNTPPTPIEKTQENLIKDQSLVYKVFDKTDRKSYSIQPLNDSIICQLNWQYWFSELPSSIYNKKDWWLGLKQEHMPCFEIIQDSTDSSQSLFSFEFNQEKVYPSFNNGKFLSDNFSLVKIKSFVDNGEVVKFTDPVFNQTFIMLSSFIDLTINYSFSPDPSKITTNYNQLSFPIVRKEKIRIFLNSYTESNFPYNYALDKTNGIDFATFNLIQGLSNRYIV